MPATAQHPRPLRRPGNNSTIPATAATSVATICSTTAATTAVPQRAVRATAKYRPTGAAAKQRSALTTAAPALPAPPRPRPKQQDLRKAVPETEY